MNPRLILFPDFGVAAWVGKEGVRDGGGGHWRGETHEGRTTGVAVVVLRDQVRGSWDVLAHETDLRLQRPLTQRGARVVDARVGQEYPD